MRIVAKSTITEYCKKRPDAQIALEDWYTKTKVSEWYCFADVKQSFRSADNIGNQHYVFNIKGNDYRLVAVIKFNIKTLYIRFIGTHSEYDYIDAKNI